jgi:tRNA (guanine37-N1)-methyltransferase
MKIDILTLFPNMFDGFLSESIIKRAVDQKKASIDVHNIRDYSNDKHKKVDDTPYGGGAGMVLMCQPIFDAVEALRTKKSKVILMTPQGVMHNQKLAYNLRDSEHLIFVCGHYEGFDERIRSIVDMEISIGDYVLTGGELPAMVVVDSVVRLIDGVIENESHEKDSFNEDLLDYPTYTKPPVFNGMEVPDVLLSGHHAKIENWRQTERIIRTLERRPDLIKHKNGYFLAKDKQNKELLYLEYSKINGLDITPKNDARREDVISVSKMILIKQSFIDKVVKMKVDKKMKGLYDKFNYLLTVEDEDNTSRVLDEAVRYRGFLIKNYINFMGEQYRDLVLRKLQIVINELNIKLSLMNEIKENELSGKSR